MAAKKKTPATRDKNCLQIFCAKDGDPDNATAKTLTRPTVQAARTIQTWQPDNDVMALADVLVEQVDDVKKGDMKRPEAMLLSQAHTLDALFNSLAQKAFVQTHMPHYETFLRLAFKAQSQCRSTLQTLSDIKNPSVVYAKQANISNGHQQINNGLPATHTQEKQKYSNELLEHTHGERLDSGEKSETISIDSDLAALG